jgi:hypothetical protein
MITLDDHGLTVRIIFFLILIIFEIIEYGYGNSIGMYLVQYFIVVVLMGQFKYGKIRFDIKKI